MITSHAVMIKEHGEPKDVLFTQKYEIDDDNLADDSVIVKVLAAPVNPSDINQIQGVYPSQPAKTTEYGTSFPSFVCGNEGLFEVVKVGKNVSDLKAGDWALPLKVCLGTWRTYGEFKKEQLFKIPGPDSEKPLSIVEASTLLVNPLSAYLMLTHFVKLGSNDWFIQNGGNSAVGKYACQIGKLLGVNSISVVRDRPDLQQVKDELTSLGTTHVITEEENNLRDFNATVKSWVKSTNGQIRLGLNGISGKSSTAVARKLGNDGLMLTYGAMSMQPVILPPSIHIFKNVTSAGFWCTPIVEKDPELKKKIVNQLIEWYQQDKLIAAPATEITPEGDLAAVYQEAVINSKKGKQLVVNK